jgi:hypothetical protein
MFTNPESGTRNVCHVTSELCPDVDVKAQARPEFGTVEKNEIAFTMKIEVVSAPGLEMGIAIGASSACFESALEIAIAHAGRLTFFINVIDNTITAKFGYANGTATVVVDVVSVVALFTSSSIDNTVAAKKGLTR